MTYFLSAFAAFVALLYFAQVYLTAVFIAALRKWQRPLLPDKDCPRTAVVLCLRGNDPFLAESIECAFGQDYPDYEVRLIIDNENDPAVAVVKSTLDRLQIDNGNLVFLEQRMSTCSLKCSSLSQVVNDLDSSFEVVALMDADTVPHRSWLRELVAPLQHSDVGAATGIRWYMPDNPGLGSMVRHAWNCAAIIQMHFYKIAWGGSLVIKRRVIEQLDLPSRWRRAFCEDTMLSGALKEQNLKLSFVPSVTMVNREHCKLNEGFHWICRQLLTARLYHPLWPAIVGHAVLSAIVPVVMLVMGVNAVTSGAWTMLLIVVVTTLGYGVMSAAILQTVEAFIGPIVANRGEPWMRVFARSWFRFLTAIAALQILYPCAVLRTALARRIDWRGITYKIGGSWDIRLVEYGPYEPGTPPIGHSL